MLRLPAHPDTVDLPGLGAPVGWMFLLTQRAVDRVPVRVQLGSLAPFDAVVRTWRTRLPGVDPAPSASLAVAAEGVRQLLVDAEPADLRGEGSGLVVDAAFPARADLRRFRGGGAALLRDLIPPYLQSALRPFPGPPARPGARCAGRPRWTGPLGAPRGPVFVGLVVGRWRAPYH